MYKEKLAHTWNRGGLSQLVACVVVVAMAVVVVVMGLGLDARTEVSHIPQAGVDAVVGRSLQV